MTVARAWATACIRRGTNGRTDGRTNGRRRERSVLARRCCRYIDLVRAAAAPGGGSGGGVGIHTRRKIYGVPYYYSDVGEVGGRRRRCDGGTTTTTITTGGGVTAQSVEETKEPLESL